MCLYVSGSKAALYLGCVKLWVQLFLCVYYINDNVICLGGGSSLIVQLVKNMAAMWETPVQSLGQEDPLEKEMATHSSTVAWKIPWMGGAW